MSQINTFEEIIAWQKARTFNKRVYEITSNDFFKKDFDLARQLRRASVSISSNISEGFERNTDKEFIHFLYIAKGSSAEIRSQLYLALDLNYVTQKEFETLFFEITTISKLISGLIKYLDKSQKS
jgi:four helix bundle protein